MKFNRNIKEVITNKKGRGSNPGPTSTYEKHALWEGMDIYPNLVPAQNIALTTPSITFLLQLTWKILPDEYFDTQIEMLLRLLTDLS